MALSRKMLEVIQKVEAAREEFLDGLRESAKREAAAKASAKKLTATRRPPMKVTKKPRAT